MALAMGIPWANVERQAGASGRESSRYLLERCSGAIGGMRIARPSALVLDACFVAAITFKPREGAVLKAHLHSDKYVIDIFSTNPERPCAAPPRGGPVPPLVERLACISKQGDICRGNAAIKLKNAGHK